ncbi:MAG: CPBP family intramembrane glutamic endopeptidase [Mariniphaga sp.]
MFLERVYEGRNDIGRWIAMTVIVLFVWQIVGAVPLGILIALKMDENPDLEPNLENPLDFTSYDISQTTGFILMMIPFILALIAMWILMNPIHERPMLSAITGHSRFRWKRLLWGAGTWGILLTIYAVFATITGIQKIIFQFNPATLFTLAAVSLLFIPLQSGFEEVFFRGYLMQGLAKLLKYRWLPLLITALIFGAIHFANPEVKAYGALITIPQYIWFGIFFGICVLMDEGLELAWGVHLTNNLFLSVFFTQDSSAIQTPALFRITDINPLFDLISLLALSIIFIFVAHKKYKWPVWNYLLAKIGQPETEDENLSEFTDDEYDE